MWDGMDRPLDAGRLGHRLGVAAALFPRQPGAARDGPRRHGPRSSDEFVAAAAARRALRLRHAGAALRPRLSAGEFHLAADQPAHRRLWRLAREPPALSARGVRGDARGLAGAQADVGAHLRDRLGRGRHHRRRRGRDRARLRARPASTSSTSRPARPCATRSRSTAACSRRRSPTRSATRPGSRPCASATSRRRTRSTPSWPPAAPISWRWAGRIWSTRPSRCSAAAWYGADIACPPQYLPGKEQIFRNSVRDRQDFDDLKIKAKPKTRAELKAEATKPLAAE